MTFTRGAPTLTHMFFADDSYIYCKVTADSAYQVLDILGTYEMASGQKINNAKSVVFFSRNVCQSVKEEVCSILQFNEADGNTHYLGLANVIGRNKMSAL